MMSRLLLLSSFVLLSVCDSATNNGSETSLRITIPEYSLEMTHNSHLNRTYSDQTNSFSLVGNITLYLSEFTDYNDIPSIQIVDSDNDGWLFSPDEIAIAYNEEDNSLTFENLQLREIESLSGIRCQILDETGEVVMTRVLDINPNLPLPAETSYSYPDSDELRIDIAFFDTPFDGGNIPFPVTIYNTYFSSNSFSIVWLNSEREEIQRNQFGTGDLISVTNDEYYINFATADIPENAAYFYTSFIRYRNNTYTELLNQLFEL